MAPAFLPIASLLSSLPSGIVLGRAAVWHVPRIRDIPRPAGMLPHDAPFVSVIVPARNEEDRLPACLEALATQEYPCYEVVVVDDESTDCTSDVVRRARKRYPHVRLVSGQPLPAGWVGKPWALHQGVAAAQGEWLLFLDADAVCTPSTVSSLIAHALNRNVDALTLLTRQDVRTIWEQAMQPAIFTVMLCGLNPRALNRSRCPRYTAANGQVFLIRRDAYQCVGGHAAVRAAIVEDFALARLLRAAGRRLEWADGRELVCVRMYRSFRHMWEGWTKNFLLPGLLTPLERTGVVALALLAGPLSYAALLLALILFCAASTTSLTWVAVLLAVLTLILQLRIQYALRHVHTGGWLVPILHPLGAAIVTAALMTALWRCLLRRATPWRGRQYEHGTVTVAAAIVTTTRPLEDMH